jgi:hypothetical protein
MKITYSTTTAWPVKHIVTLTDHDGEVVSTATYYNSKSAWMRIDILKVYHKKAKVVRNVRS